MNKNLLAPFLITVLISSFGFALFETFGAFIGFDEDKIRDVVSNQIKVHQNVNQIADADVDASVDEAYDRLTFFHLHGYSLSIVTFLLGLFIVNSSATDKVKRIVTWISSISGLLYPVGWLLASWFITTMGVDGALKVGEYGFFMPFGGALIIMTWVVFIYMVKDTMLRKQTK